MSESEFISQEDARGLYDVLVKHIKEVKPDYSIWDRNALLEIGTLQYIIHKMNGYCEDTSIMWAKIYITNSKIVKGDRE